MSATTYSCGRARLAFLLAGTAAIALLAGKVAHAITINDQTAQQSGLGFVVPPLPPFAPVGALPNYWDMTNMYSNVGLINLPGVPPIAGCTGTLINSRTVLTAAHCFIGDNGTYDLRCRLLGHEADIRRVPSYVGFRGISGHREFMSTWHSLPPEVPSENN